MTTNDILKSATSNTKIIILCWSLAKPNGITVSELTKLERTNISKQILEMKKIGILEMKSEGRNNFYSLSKKLKPIQIDLIKAIVNSFHIIDEKKINYKKY